MHRHVSRSDPRVSEELAVGTGVAIKPGPTMAGFDQNKYLRTDSGVFTLRLNDLLDWDRNWYAGTRNGHRKRLMNRRETVPA